MQDPRDRESHPAHSGAASGVLVLADGRVFRGRGFGARGTAVGEVVFNTSMFGYQEIVSDPSYAGQVVCLTAVEVGNVGCNPDDDESDRPAAVGLVVRSLSPVVSNWRATQALEEWLVARNVVGLAEIDTRALTRHLRTEGSVMGVVSNETDDVAVLQAIAKSAPSMDGRNLVDGVTAPSRHEWDQPSWSPKVSGTAGAGVAKVSGTARAAGAGALRVVAWDFGIKRNILRKLEDRALQTTVVPASTTARQILAELPDGVLLSNGPGDPAAVVAVIEQLRLLLSEAPNLPVFGVCLGHQLLCLALGGRTYKLKFGHHGGNHPVRDERDRSIAITAQNHGFAVDLASLGEKAELTHLNLFDQTVAGMRMKGRPVSGVQYHPEASPGPHDSDALFDHFVEQVRNYGKARIR
jgi:carbamoyl-phosphate synthase small subunit